ncbi:nucleotidyltransferase family protein [Micromonospora sp. C28SCA-DRY-2]|uniref:nucleotidyltransferase family protein n=1 Tax=Micromonospora sp. C28SCA-DRY-2 TaxID=3059522 RepID=UPI002676D08B|nr:nucleotidyltransferase family protein [Micromonospora sp. C28SCA-DRY-2]MDO3702131.1 nucleotidyltransferase family protein [Micromonospora sp. C28SCA-DRY-2]
MGRHERELGELVRGSPWVLRALAVVRDSGLPDAWIGAGTLRDLVWGERYGDGFDPGAVRDVDVVFFDPGDLSRDNDHRATARLVAAWAEPPWEARNQAAVHTWYADTFGGDPIPPYRSVAEAVATWPEYATAVAVRLDATDRLEVCAPYGLADLLGGLWRHNPARVDVARSRQRLARHRPAQRWPGVTVVEPG